MDKPFCSYTLTLSASTGVDLTHADQYLQQQNIVPRLLTHTRIHCPGSSSIIQNTYQTTNLQIPQWEDAFTMAETLAKTFPQISVEIIETCEVTYTPQKKQVYSDGKLVECLTGRVLNAKDQLDRPTIKACIQFLLQQNMPDAAYRLETMTAAHA